MTNIAFVYTMDLRPVKMWVWMVNISGCGHGWESFIVSFLLVSYLYFSWKVNGSLLYYIMMVLEIECDVLIILRGVYFSRIFGRIYCVIIIHTMTLIRWLHISQNSCFLHLYYLHVEFFELRDRKLNFYCSIIEWQLIWILRIV